MSWENFSSKNTHEYNSCLNIASQQKEQQDYNESKRIPEKIIPKPSYATCFKCKSNEIFIHVQQTRSSDEGATTFFTCSNSNCKNRWTAN